MRILHLDAGREMRGGQWQVARLIDGLLARGHECRLLAPAGVPLRTHVRCETADLGLLSLLRAAAAADIIHAHDGRSHTLAVLAGAGPRLVVARRVAFAKRGGWLARLRYRRPARFIAISPAAVAPLAALQVPAAKIVTVPDGVPLLPESTREPGFVVAPGGGKGRELLAEAARLAGVPLHFSSDLDADLARASLFLYSSDAEGLGSAALLAQSASVPVIASDIPGLRAAVEPEVSGLLVPNFAPDFAAALRRLLDDSLTAQRMGRAGRLRVEQSFTIDAMVDRTVEVYRAVMGR